MTDTEIAGIIFNETRSLSGDKMLDARVNIAHAVVNGEKTGKRPKSSPTKATVPDVEKSTYESCVSAVAAMRRNVTANTDPTGGATNFNFRKNDWTGDFFGKKIKTQIGPLNNSYPTKDLPASGIYANTYG